MLESQRERAEEASLARGISSHPVKCSVMTQMLSFIRLVRLSYATLKSWTWPCELPIFCHTQCMYCHLLNMHSLTFFLIFFLCVKSLHHCFGAGTHVCCSLSTASENLPQTATFKAGSCAASCWLTLNLINCGIFTALSVTLSRLILFLLHETKLTERWEDWRQILSTVWVWSHICLVRGAFGFCGGVLCSHSKCPQLELKSCSPPSRCTDASLPCWNGLCCSIAISQDCPQTDSLFLHPNPPTCHLLHLLTACLIPLLSPPTNNT